MTQQARRGAQTTVERAAATAANTGGRKAARKVPGVLAAEQAAQNARRKADKDAQGPYTAAAPAYFPVDKYLGTFETNPVAAVALGWHVSRTHASAATV